MPLNDDDMEAMVSLLQDKTHMGRFNQAEVRDVLRYLESQGADLKPEPVVVTVPRAELEEVKPAAQLGEPHYWTAPNEDQHLYD